MKNKQGFTLVEILFVLCIIIILSSIVIPRFYNIIPVVKLDADAQQLAWVLRNARQEAVNSGSYKMVVFYPQENQYRYKNKIYQFNPGIMYIGTTTFSEYANRPACIFLPSGRANGGTVVIKCENQQKSVIVLGTTGRIRVSD